jgi:16S rRNA (guanine527-N7)-methyltransferase
VAATELLLDRWLAALIATPGLTALGNPVEARCVHVEQSLAALEHVRRFTGPVVDVGSGGGAPGIPLAASMPDRGVVLLEPSARKCAFLERWTTELSNLEVVRGRAEEQEIEQWGVAVAKALAPPSVAAEWCLPLVRQGGAVVLFVGATADLGAVARVAAKIGGGEPERHPGFAVIPKLEPTPPGFPRRPGMARKRPLV